ncbi:hypothetical protein MVES1_002615 [Malassezia vespertilionis]|uniref:Pentatricopeptide repeat-containing protein-mitochondrial domain-containing protein n=1 Tax=Malassezia vespertilionis TaxID=2020962 RepID=A0A2N1JAD9_9BASI|nr:uncharacterized protein MVES1_002615 [Malassezia vespertilionis]PKI83519.1 hypothetical protein MVES_002469 [Malassezia vespertilionis]WFD07255.1 hypothetical protein MVES1_002615 [Malassezia vespertilionis]
MLRWTPVLVRASVSWRHYSTAAAPHTDIEELLQRLGAHSKQSNAFGTLRDCVRLKQCLQAPNVEQALTKRVRDAVHDALLRVFASQGMLPESLAVLDDIAMCGEKVGLSAYNWALQAAAVAGNVPEMLAIVKKMAHEFSTPTHTILSPAAQASFTPTTYTRLLQYCAATKNSEYALLLVSTAFHAGMSLEHEAQKHVLQCMYETQQPALAYDLALRFEASPISPPKSLWMEVLRIAAELDYAPALPDAWSRCMRADIIPDEGLVLYILLTAARAGQGKFANSVLDAIPRLFPGTRVKEWHFVPVLDAFCRTHAFADAVSVLGRMQRQGVSVGTKAAAKLTTHSAADEQALLKAEQALLAHDTIPVAALNAILYAAAELAALPVALRIWDALVCTERATPDVDTHNALLLCCIPAHDVRTGEHVWTSLHTRQLEPSPSTYERMARLYLTQPDYERAFALLEEVKQRGHIPSRRTYASMVWTCIQREDDRWRGLLAEMQEAQYDPGDRLREAIALQETST